MDGGGVAEAVLVGESGAEEVHEVVGDVILDGGAITEGVDGAEGGAVEAEVGVRLEGVAISLRVDLRGDAAAEVGLGCWGGLACFFGLLGDFVWWDGGMVVVLLTDSSRPEAEAHW